MVLELGSASVQRTATALTCVRAPRSVVRLALVSVGAQVVARLPSTAASAYIPASSDVAVAGLQRATLLVGARSGRRVGTTADELTVLVPAGVSSGNGLPERSVTVVLVAPIWTSNVRPRQCSPRSVTPP